MFRDMRRKKQLLTDDDCVAILERGTSGVLAVSGDDGYPYAVPLSYVYRDGKIYFHCAKTGHKLDAIAQHDKVSFCVIDLDDVKPEIYSTHYRSVIAFGRAQILDDEADKRSAFEILAAKYSPDDPQGRAQEIDKQLKNVCIFAVAIEHMTGKAAKELIPEKHA